MSLHTPPALRPTTTASYPKMKTTPPVLPSAVERRKRIGYLRPNDALFWFVRHSPCRDSDVSDSRGVREGGGNTSRKSNEGSIAGDMIHTASLAIATLRAGNGDGLWIRGWERARRGAMSSPGFHQQRREPREASTQSRCSYS